MMQTPTAPPVYQPQTTAGYTGEIFDPKAEYKARVKREQEQAQGQVSGAFEELNTERDESNMKTDRQLIEGGDSQKDNSRLLKLGFGKLGRCYAEGCDEIGTDTCAMWMCCRNIGCGRFMCDEHTSPRTCWPGASYTEYD